MSLNEEKAILSLWKSNEKKRFGEIRRELNKKFSSKTLYDQKQVDRYLKRLIEKGLLCKYEDEQGSYYVPRDAPLHACVWNIGACESIRKTLYQVRA